MDRQNERYEDDLRGVSKERIGLNIAAGLNLLGFALAFHQFGTDDPLGLILMGWTALNCLVCAFEWDTIKPARPRRANMMDFDGHWRTE